MTKYEISQELAQKILNYLGSRPYVEVQALIPGLLALKEISTASTGEEANEAVTPDVVE